MQEILQVFCAIQQLYNFMRLLSHLLFHLVTFNQQHLRCSSLAPNTAVQFDHFLSSNDVDTLNSYLDHRLQQRSDEGESLARRLIVSKGPVDYVQSGYDQLHGTTLPELRRLCDVYDRVRVKVTATLHGGGAVWQQHASFQVYHENGFHSKHADTDIDRRCVTASVGLDSHRDGNHAGGRFVVFDPQHLNKTTHTSHSERGSLVVFRAESLHGVEKVTAGIRRVMHVWYGCERPRCSDSRCTPVQQTQILMNHPIVRRASADRIDPMVMACEAIKESSAADAAASQAKRLIRVSGCRVVKRIEADEEDDVIWCDRKRSSSGPDPPFPNVRGGSDL